MRSFLAVLIAAVLTFTSGSFVAYADGPDEKDKRSSCAVRQAPDKKYDGEAWLVYHDDGKGNWIVTNIGYTLKSVGLPQSGDNQIYVQVMNDGHSVGKYEYKSVPNLDLKTQENIWPWLTVPKGKLAIYTYFYVSMKSWPQQCHSAGLQF